MNYLRKEFDVFLQLLPLHAGTDGVQHDVRPGPARDRGLRGCVCNAELACRSQGCYVSVVDLCGYATGLLSEWETAGPRWSQASLRRWNGALGSRDDADDAIQHPHSDRRRDFGLHHGIGDWNLLGQPRIPRANGHE